VQTVMPLSEAEAIEPIKLTRLSINHPPACRSPSGIYPAHRTRARARRIVRDRPCPADPPASRAADSAVKRAIQELKIPDGGREGRFVTAAMRPARPRT